MDRPYGLYILLCHSPLCCIMLHHRFRTQKICQALVCCANPSGSCAGSAAAARGAALRLAVAARGFLGHAMSRRVVALWHHRGLLLYTVEGNPKNPHACKPQALELSGLTMLARRQRSACQGDSRTAASFTSFSANFLSFLAPSNLGQLDVSHNAGECYDMP